MADGPAGQIPSQITAQAAAAGEQEVTFAAALGRAATRCPLQL